MGSDTHVKVLAECGLFMRNEIENVVTEIEQAIALLRRHL